MKLLDTQRIFRLTVFLLALLILVGSLLYSRFLANQLEQKERADIQLYGEAQRIVGGDPNADPFGFIFDNFIKQPDERIPRMMLGENGMIESSIPDLDTMGLDKAAQEAVIQQTLDDLRRQNPPIEIEWAEGKYKYIYFGESYLLKQLRWFPVFQLLVAFAFIGIVFLGFALAQRSEQNKVWVGLAKETAHQLGTPVSSLMAWVELLKMRVADRPKDQEMLEEMERDILRLEKITERFSKIGSQPDLQPENLKDILERSSSYLKSRMTRKGNIHLEIHNELPEASILHINPLLFDWVIENLLKNALDAIKSEEGEIQLRAGTRGKSFFIDVSDTGKGIPKSHFRKVFQPGFTTKKRGWGLGLSLSKRIIEQYHKGRIFVKQSEVGKGTTFRIILPRD